MVLLLNVIFTALVVSACLPALIWGGWEGRQTCAMFIIAGIATGAASISAMIPIGQSATLFSLDVLLAAGLLRIALKTNRYWPLWICSFQALSILTFVAWKIILGAPSLFQTVAGFWSIPQLVVLCIGPILDNIGDHRAGQSSERAAPTTR